MKIQLKMLVGVAVFATLALAGMIGVFAFSAAQPVQAQGATPSATRSLDMPLDMSTVAPGGQVMVTITAANTGDNPWKVTETLPAGFTTSDGDAVAGMPNKRDFTSFGGPAITYTVAVGSTVTDGPYTISGTLRARPGDAPGMDYPIADSTVTVAAGTTSTPMTRTASSSVAARPDDPGDLTQITVMFTTSKFLAIDESITLEVSDDLGVPGSIDESDVSISGQAAACDVEMDTCNAAMAEAGPEVAAPRSVIVETDAVAERYVITLNIGNMDDSADRDSDKGLAPGEVTVVFRQGAGITNRTEGGGDDWFVKTSKESWLDTLPETLDEDGEVDLKAGQIATATVYPVPWTIDLSDYKDSRGAEITAIGKGFKNGTTTTFWIDKDRDGMIGTGEDELCDAVANGHDIATCKFTLGNPPFAPGKANNYINAVDGRDKKAGIKDTVDGDGNIIRVNHPFGVSQLNRIELEPSLSVSPKQGNPGDSINYQLKDFHPGSGVTRIQFARSIYICGDSDDSGQGCPTGKVGTNGNLSFSFDIPNNIGAGAQDLKVWTVGTEKDANGNVKKDADGNDVIVNGDDNITFTVGAGDLQLSSTNVLPNQRISISASGFTKSSNRNPAYIGDRKRPIDNACGVKTGSVILGGEEVPWERINDNEAIEVTSGGTWSATIDLPINSATVVAGTRTLKVTDCQGGEASIDLIFAEREVTMTPEEGGVGTEVVITGKNFPVRNDDGTDIEVWVAYDPTVGKTDDDDVEPDAVGSFTVILEVPEDAGIPSNNTVKVLFIEDDGSEVLDTFTHRVPQGTVSFNTTRGAEGSTLTITANGFARYTNVDLIEFDGREITPSPKPSTDTNGNGSFDIRIPGSDPGIYIIRVEIEEVVATSTFTVVSGSGASDATVETVLANLISEGAMDRIFRFDNETKTWQWYIADPAFAASNNLAGLSASDLVFIKVTQDITVDILGTSTPLTCINEGLETEDCWNTISIP